ncbi:unnamed protein product [Linum tenue]|uniref:Uncharacterized protein n=1 Tax=Linum tenue TaxID=586396 RepID=A0AAV0QKZ7_9ROSI|nr:unnamed protein product [Linum tenue]CAI0546175.1 unnamed protein product [Linum tenue]CAI0546178.1 unnamed protein product [Linum tenue]
MHSSPLSISAASLTIFTINPCPEDCRRFASNGFSPFLQARNTISNGTLQSPPPVTRRRNLARKFNANCRALQSDGVAGGQTGKVEGEGEGEGEESLQLVTAVRSKYNDIAIVDTPTARVLLLDSTHSVHSVLQKGQKWTDSYWDEFASLPPIVPEGPISILGLGGGTAAHLMLDLWPSLELEGWEIDDILIHKARVYFGLSDLEKHTPAGGRLHVRIGDALSPAENDSGRYAGIIVDLFSEGKVLPQLELVSTWLEMKRRLMPDGRIMVNCAGIHGTADSIDRTNHNLEAAPGGDWVEHDVIKAMSEAFPGQLCWKRMEEDKGANYLALTGPLPDLSSWSAMVPDRLKASVGQWKPCDSAKGKQQSAL